MIPKPKKRSSRLYFLVLLTFFLPTAVFCIYTSFYQQRFLFLLVIALVVNLAFLIFFHYRLTRKKSEISLQKEDYFEKANLLKAELDKEWQAIESFRKKIVSYSQLKDLTERLSMCLTLADTSNCLSSEVNRLFGDKDITVILYLFHSRTGELGLSSSQKGQMQVNIKSKKGDIFDHWVVKTLQPLLIEDTKKDFRFDVEKMMTEDNRPIRSLISVPLMVGDKALGIVRIDSPRQGNFVTDDLRFLLTIADVGSIAIENAQLYEHIEELAIKDGLTGLYLRRYMLDRLSEELNRELRRGKDLSFLMIDLDRFKKYNDTFGHIAGDIVLRMVARILKQAFNEPGNLVCRYGGEEFCVLLPDCSREKAVKMAQDVKKQVEGQDVILRRQKTHITISIGVASFPRDAQLREELIFKADHALYQAKEQGRNRVQAA